MKIGKLQHLLQKQKHDIVHVHELCVYIGGGCVHSSLACDNASHMLAPD